MNKLFKKMMKNRGLSMFLALAMLLTLIPFNTVFATTVSDSDAAGYEVSTEAPVVENAGEPAVTLDVASAEAKGCTVVANEDGSYDITYTVGSVSDAFPVNVTNPDPATYTKVAMLVTPPAGMNLGIYDQDWSTAYRDHWGAGVFADDSMQWIDFTLKADSAGFLLFLDIASPTLIGEQTFKIHSMQLVGSDWVAPEVIDPNKPVVVDVTLQKESSDLDIDDQGRLYSATGGKMRGMIEFPVDFKTVEVGKEIVINYETNIPTVTAELCYDNGSGGMVTDTELLSTGNKWVIPVTDEIVTFFANSPATYTGDTSTRIRLKQNTTGAESYFKLISVTYGNPVEEEEEEEIVPQIIVGQDSAYTRVDNEDGSMTFTYNADTMTWSVVRIAVSGYDLTKYTQLQIDMDPADAMVLGIYDMDKVDGGDYAYRSHSELDENGRTTVKVDLLPTSKGVKLYCDAGEVRKGAGEQTFTIYGIKLVDPNVPEGEVIDTQLQVESGAFTLEGNTVSGAAGAKMRCMFELPVDFRVEEGKQLVIGYETNLEDIYMETAYGTSSKVVFYDPVDTAEKSYVVNIDQTWVDFINNNGGQNPRIRIKSHSDAIAADGYFTLKYVIYRDVPAQEFDPAGVPQGVAVTYYDDIYSRGVAWNTKDLVALEGVSALYYVENDGTLTAETVDWSTATKVPATGKAYTAVAKGTETVWHTFKAVAEDLTPGAKYFFRVGCEEFGWSDVGSFTIDAAEADINSLHFIHVTDTQEEQLAQFKKYAKMVKAAYDKMPNAAFMAHTGDHVNNGENDENMLMDEWMYVLDAPKANLLNSIYMPCVGNHDAGTQVFADRFAIDWADYIVDSDADTEKGGVYAKTYGKPENGVLIISLNTNDLWSSKFQEYQQPWLEQTLETYKDYKWKIVQMHAGAITAGDHAMDGESKYLRKNVMPIFAKYEVDLVLQGHDHVYTRSRSMAYGVNPFETEDEANPVYFDGHTPIYLGAEKKTLTVNGEERTIYVEPQGTHYITINASGGKRYPEEDPSTLDPIIPEAEGDNPINPKDEDGKYGSICQLDFATYGLVSIEGDVLVYDTYTYDSSTNTSTLYDTFAVDKSSNRGYDPENPHEGKTEVQLYGIKVAASKKYDGQPMKLDLTGFNCSNPAIMDTASLKYTMEVLSGGVDPVTNAQYRFNPGNLIYGMMPKEPGTYKLTISLPQNNKDFYGEVSFEFTITE